MEQGADRHVLFKLQRQLNGFGHRVKIVVMTSNCIHPARSGVLLVADWMTAQPKTISRHASLRPAAEVMELQEIRHLPVMDLEHLIGIVSDRDVRLAWASKASSLRRHELVYLLVRMTVEESMTVNPIIISPATRLATPATVLLQERIGALPVVEGGTLVGILCCPDILGAFLGELQD